MLGFGLLWWRVPDDYQQGATVRIMFVHVPAAWMALFTIVSYFCQHCGGGVAPSFGLLAAARPPGRRGVHACGFGHGRAVGPAHVGHMVGVGCTPHLCLGVAVHYLDISPCGRRLTIMAARRAPRQFWPLWAL